ncbi:CYTH domain-containing protein [Colwellia sp. MEBiC06753]
MSTEIELKYLVDDPNIVEKLSGLLNQHNIAFKQKSRCLTNTYFDTPDNQLRALDFGLRVRKADDYTEQTIKTAGVTLGGLHQRPEYNVAIAQSQPNLSLFPSDIWPEGLELNTLASSLVPLFTTDFTRHTWLISLDEGEIEVAYDQGQICSGERLVTINEIELELVSGKRNALFSFAELLFSHFNLAAGTDSKAARGYRLWHNLGQGPEQGSKQGSEQEIEQNEISRSAQTHLILSLEPEDTVAQALVKGVGYGLTQLQYAIKHALISQELADVRQVYEAILFIQHGLLLHEALIDDEQLAEFKQLTKAAIESLSWLENAIHINDLIVKSGRYRNKLEYSKQLISTLKLARSQFPDEIKIRQLLTAPVINHLQLVLLKFVLSPLVKPSQEVRLVSTFASQKLTQSLNALTKICADKKTLSALDYIVMQHHLYQSLNTGSWYGSLFDVTYRENYRRTWIDVFQGIEELSTLILLQKQLEALEERATKLENWLHNKIDNLLLAIEHSYQAASTIEPYWQ